MDVLTDIVRILRLRSEVYGRLELSEPWGLRIDPACSALFLAVDRGGCWLEAAHYGPVSLAGGDFVFLHVREASVLSSHPGATVEPLSRLLSCEEHRRAEPFRYGGGGRVTSLMIGGFSFDNPESDLLVGSLPPMIHVRADSGPSEQWLQSTLQLMACETARAEPGSQAVISRLADVLFVQALRTQMRSACPEHGMGWLRALTDIQIGAALRRMHAHPEWAWTVPNLAQEVAMSRSAFAARFKALVGDGPLEYLTRWRMLRAAYLLRESNGSVREIATAVGYATESAFGKAFRRRMSVSPSEYRRDHGSGARPAG